MIEPGYDNYAIEREILAEFVSQIQVVPEGMESDRKGELLKDADAVLVREAIVDEALMDQMERCRVIVRYGIGVDNIDLEAARKRKIAVANVPRYGADEVSSHAVALLLAVSRWIVRRDRDVRTGVWGVGALEPIDSFKDMDLGIVGFGAIARAFLEKMRPFGFKKIWVHDPALTAEEIEAHQAEKASIETLCKHAEVISLHAPLTEQTRHMIAADQFELMRPRTIIVNTGRGPLIDERALLRALTSGKIRGAGIDVFENEPPDRSHPLFELNNVVVSDHAAWYSERSIAELQRNAAGEVRRVFAGKDPTSWLNPW